jgi:integrase
MGTVYARGNKLWIGYKDTDGTRKYAPTKFTVGQEPKARKLLDAIERRIQAAATFGEGALGPLTVRSYFERWIEDRRSRNVASAGDDETRLRAHALPELAELVLADVRPTHVRALVRNLKSRVGPGREQLAPRTVRHVYGVLHRMFEDAIADELIDSNPCAIKRGELPAKIDKDPTWRSGAVFTREEVEQLISDERIPEDRRTLYAVLFLSGMRIGEIAACRWRAYDATTNPLGRLLVASSFNRKKRLEKPVKTERPREVPVHRTLASVLASWKLGGWERMMGRPPTADDLLVPSCERKHLLDPQVLLRFHQDLLTLGFRPRRTHDTRRTFVSLSLADGARRDILRWITHGPEGDIVSLYTSLPWTALCEEVAKLNIGLRAGQLLELRKASNSGGDPDIGGGDLLQRLLQTQRVNEKALNSRGLEGSCASAQGGTRTRTPCGATPSRWCVYQFHHLGLDCILLSRPTSVNAESARSAWAHLTHCLRQRCPRPPLSPAPHPRRWALPFPSCPGSKPDPDRRRRRPACRRTKAPAR